MDPFDGQMVKIRAEVTRYEWPEYESFWADPLGDDLYRLGNIPFFVYDLHLHDIVRAVSEQAEQIPTIVEVVERSGRKTLRVMFDKALSDEDAKRTLDGMIEVGVTYEKGQGRFFALDVPPEADYMAVCDALWRLEQAGRLNYETGTTESDVP